MEEYKIRFPENNPTLDFILSKSHNEKEQEKISTKEEEIILKIMNLINDFDKKEINDNIMNILPDEGSTDNSILYNLMDEKAKYIVGESHNYIKKKKDFFNQVKTAMFGKEESTQESISANPICKGIDEVTYNSATPTLDSKEGLIKDIKEAGTYSVALDIVKRFITKKFFTEENFEKTYESLSGISPEEKTKVITDFFKDNLDSRVLYAEDLQQIGLIDKTFSINTISESKSGKIYKIKELIRGKSQEALDNEEKIDFEPIPVLYYFIFICLNHIITKASVDSDVEKKKYETYFDTLKELIILLIDYTKLLDDLYTYESKGVPPDRKYVFFNHNISDKTVYAQEKKK